MNKMNKTPIKIKDNISSHDSSPERALSLPFHKSCTVGPEEETAAANKVKKLNPKSKGVPLPQKKLATKV